MITFFIFEGGECAKRLHEGAKITLCEGGNEEQTDVLFPLGFVGKVTSACRYGDVMMAHALLQIWCSLRFIHNVLKSPFSLDKKRL